MTSPKPTTPPKAPPRLPTVRELIEQEEQVRKILRARSRRRPSIVARSLCPPKPAEQDDMTSNTTTIAGPAVVSGGDVARVIKEPNGSGRIEVWKRGAGWVAAEGSVTPDELMPGACRPASANDAARLGCRLEDFGRHWTEEPASTADRKKLVHLLKEQAWHLAARQVPPGRG